MGRDNESYFYMIFGMPNSAFLMGTILTNELSFVKLPFDVGIHEVIIEEEVTLPLRGVTRCEPLRCSEEGLLSSPISLLISYM